MHYHTASLAVLITAAIALQSPHQRVRDAQSKSRQGSRFPSPLVAKNHPESSSSPAFLTRASEAFAVNGTSIPQVDFDVGESYAGLLPNTPSGNTSLFFWFFPTDNPAASNEITIWLQGGPGCSSMAGLLQENGPISWQPGTSAPIRNPYSWTNLTNMVWVDQPAGAGYSPGPATVQNEIDVANQFNDFWKNFMTTFGMEYYNVYIAGESYAGQYIPYIAENMLDRGDLTYYDLKGIQINDPVVNYYDALENAPAAMYMNNWPRLLGLNESFMSDINERAATCGYTEFMEHALL
ncbi:MAG: hypothetical protein Q9218_005246, partial [Villophora microphyllina]